MALRWEQIQDYYDNGAGGPGPEQFDHNLSLPTSGWGNQPGGSSFGGYFEGRAQRRVVKVGIKYRPYGVGEFEPGWDGAFVPYSGDQWLLQLLVAPFGGGTSYAVGVLSELEGMGLTGDEVYREYTYATPVAAYGIEWSRPFDVGPSNGYIHEVTVYTVGMDEVWPAPEIVYSLPFDVEARFYDRLTGERLRFNPDELLDCSWTLTEAGGTETIRLRLAKPFDDLTFPLAPGCLVECIVLSDPIPDGEIEPHPRVRGILSQQERTLDMAENCTLLAYGLMEDMLHVPLDGNLAEPGGADLSEFAGRVLASYVQERPWLDNDPAKPARLRYVTDIQNTDVQREVLEIAESDCRKAQDALASQAPGLLVWGWRVDAVTGANQFVFKAKTETVDHQLFAGDNVKVISRPLELSQVLNTARIKGGQSPWPNLLAAAVEGNTSFEYVDLRGAVAGNLILNYDFSELTGSNVNHWEFYGGFLGTASPKTGGLSEGPTYHGPRMAELDTEYEGIRQNRVGVLTAGQEGNSLVYEAEVRLEQGGQTREAVMRLKWLDAAGVLLSSAPDVPVKPTSGAWGGLPKVRGSAIIPAGARGFTVEIEATAVGAGGILVGLVRVYDQDRVYPRGWETLGYGGAAFSVVDPQYPDFWPGHWGRRCIRIKGTFSDADGQDGHLRPINLAMFSVSPNQQVDLVIRAKRAPGATGSGKLLLEIHGRNDKGESTTVYKGVIAANAIGDAWGEFYASYTASADTTRLTAFITFRGDTDILIDCVQVRDTGAGLETDLSHEFITGANWERLVRAEDLCAPGSDAAESVNLYDRREGYVSNPTLLRWDAAAEAWATAFLTQKAALLSRPRVDLIHEPTRIVDPLDATQIRLSGMALDVTGDGPIPDAWAARVEYRWGKSTLSVSIPLGEEPPSLARLIGSKEGGGGSVAAGGASVSGGSVAGGALPPVGGDGSAAGGVSSLNTLEGALTLGAGAGINVSVAGSTITVASTGVTSLNGETGAVSLINGTGTVVTDNGNGTLQIDVTGGGTGIEWSHNAYQRTSGGNLYETTGRESLIVHGENAGLTLGPSATYNIITVLNRRPDSGSLSISAPAGSTLVPASPVTLAYGASARFICLLTTAPSTYTIYQL